MVPGKTRICVPPPLLPDIRSRTGLRLNLRGVDPEITDQACDPSNCTGDGLHLNLRGVDPGITSILQTARVQGGDCPGRMPTGSPSDLARIVRHRR